MVSAYLSIFFTVVLLVTTAYFILGGIPLLVLAHDTPVDGRFVRRFFEVYYSAALIGSIGSTASYALWGKPSLAIGSAAIALVVLFLRRSILPAMERLSARIQLSDAGAISGFRKVHGAALLVNLVQLVLVVWGVLQLNT